MLAAWGFTAEGRKVLLALMAGSKEDTETVSAFFQDMRSRGLGDPLLVASDGAPGIIKAIAIDAAAEVLPEGFPIRLFERIAEQLQSRQVALGRAA